MRRGAILWISLAICPPVFASYYFECSADVETAAAPENDMINIIVIKTKECCGHLAAGEKKKLRFTSQLTQKLRKGAKHQVLYKYLAPECMQKDGKTLDCHRESIEFVK